MSAFLCRSFILKNWRRLTLVIISSVTTFVRKNGAPSVCDQMRDNITSDQVVDLEDEEIEPAIVKVSTGNSTKTYHHSLNEEEALKAAIAASLDHQRRNKGGRTLGFAGSSTWSANNAPNTANSESILSFSVLTYDFKC